MEMSLPRPLSYNEDSPVKIAESASLIPCNLTVLQALEEGGLAYGVISKQLATVTYVAPDATTATDSKRIHFSGSEEDTSYKSITGVEWCHLKSSRVVFVVTSYRGFKISNWDGSELIYESLFDIRKGSYDQRFAKGVSSVDNVVCVGTSEGSIIVLYVPPTGSNVVFSRQLQGHSAPITALCSCTVNQIASSDESGMIIVWSNPVISAESRLVINEPGDFPCLCLCHWRSILVGGFSNGMIRLYNIDSGHKMIEIAAHGRSITALDIAQDTGLLLSVSEDCTTCVWRLPSETAESKVFCLFCAHISNLLLCGGKFTDHQGDTFALTAFGSDTVLTFRKQSTHTA